MRLSQILGALSLLSSTALGAKSSSSKTDNSTLHQTSDEQVVGTFIFSRHGDRLTYPSTVFTPLGAQEMTSLGTFYHDRYFDSSSPYAIDGLSKAYTSSQIAAFVADTNDDVWAASAWAFIQGLYPPVELTADKKNTEQSVKGSSLSNGSVAVAPLGGYQYVFFDSVDATSEEGYQVLGQNNCPASAAAANSYLESDEFKKMNESTLEWYQSLYPMAYADFAKEDLNFGNAFLIKDYFLVESIHNKTFVEMFKNFDQSLDDILAKLNAYQGVYSRNYFFNPNPNLVRNSTIEGRSLLKMVLEQLNETKTTSQPYISYTVGAYSTFYQLFGLMGLYQQDESKYTGMVNYGSSMAFELIEKKGTSSLNVRVSFRNGTDEKMTLDPLTVFGFNSTTVPYSKFVSYVSSIVVNDTQSWCNQCGAWNTPQCALYTPQYLAVKENGFKLPPKLSNEAAGGIGAGVTIGVGLLIAGIVCLGIWAYRKYSRPDIKLTPIEPVTDKEDATDVMSKRSTRSSAPSTIV